MAFASYFLVVQIEQKTIHQEKISIPRFSIVTFVFLVALAISMRGSVWRYPLQVEDIYVSNSKFINALVPNAAYMLKKAMKEKKKAFQTKTVKELLGEHHFADLNEALRVYTQGRVTLHGDTMYALRTALFQQIPDTLSKPQPNIVVIFAESWSNYLLQLDSPESDMQLSLREHLKEDLVFRNFQSVRNSTIASIENITVSTPFIRFFNSQHRFNLMPSSIAIPFRQSGYITTFISGMDLAWENCGEALPYQKFDKVIGKYALLKEHHEYQNNSIGVYDGHLFNSIFEHLNKPAPKPKMILAMTTTNHPPFEFPNPMDIPSLPASFYDNPCFAERNRDILEKYIKGYRYFNDALGNFLRRIKQSPASKNTIIIVTGDHNVRSILDYKKVAKRWQYSVPLYVYLPPYLRKASHKSMTNRWGDHDDILSTIAPMALKHTSYFKLGKNLLDETADYKQYYSYNEEQLLADKSVEREARRHADAKVLLSTLYLQLFIDKKK